MEIKIGIRQSNRELSIETDASVDDIVAKINEATANDSVISLTDTKNRTVLVPSQALAYVEIGTDTPHRVGFGIG